jgi:hypothetical protein
LADKDKPFKEIISATIEGISEALEDKNVAALGVLEFELAVIAKKTAGGKIKLFLAEAGADYQKEEISKIKFWVGSKRSDLYRTFGSPF